MANVWHRALICCDMYYGKWKHKPKCDRFINFTSEFIVAYLHYFEMKEHILFFSDTKVHLQLINKIQSLVVIVYPVYRIQIDKS